ncbi:FkbM family methyltransferase [Roseiarcaceae bacterium H3SJ34-1]|uniref:FkbM family methyltransferase n=1 Tax=Terripilifer ovatus TaxID=3032367 RepID=UPI003AB96ECF|nr:FkbM family methyltransferase [Roseiarcaceae bacterium H3SJ34-1]
MTNRIELLVRRFMKAQSLGFGFYGTTKTKLPTEVFLAGKKRSLHLPQDPALVAAIMDLWLDDEYGLAKVPKPVRTIVDIGANVGLFSLWSVHNFPDAVIHSYEPSPELRRYFTANTADFPQVTFFNEGVSLNSGRAEMASPSSSLIGITKPADSGAIVLTGIAEVMKRVGRPVDLMKIDCEGAEWDIFQDPASLRNVRHIRMEYHLVDGRSIKSLEEAADAIGFKIIKRIDNAGFGIAHLSNKAAA